MLQRGQRQRPVQQANAAIGMASLSAVANVMFCFHLNHLNLLFKLKTSQILSCSHYRRGRCA